MSAAIYDYTPTQARVVELYNNYRTALMNAKYYARRLEWLKRINVTLDVAVALAASSAFGGFAIWKNDIGRNVFSFLLGLAALISALRPVVRIPDKIDRYAKLHYGYLEVYYRIQSLVAEMRADGHFNAEHEAKATDLTERFRSLELEGDAYQNPKKLLKYQDEIERAIPADQLWLPPE